MKYPFVRPEIAPVEEWQELLQVAYSRRYFTNFGELETRLSTCLKEKFGGSNASVTLAANATCGLTAALLGHDVQGMVAIPNFTFPATLDAVLSARCEPVLCDIDPDTLEMSPPALDRLCQAFPIAAVMPVRSYGFVRDLSSLIAVARSRAIPVIIDAAAALGAGRIEIADDVTEVLSMHATKSLGIGEGGAIFSHENRLQAMRQALNFGIRPDRCFDFGINGKMSEFHAAIGIAQLNHIDRLIDGRKNMASFYDKLLGDYRGVTLPYQPGPTAWSNYPILLPQGADTEAFQDACHERGLQVRRYYWPTLQSGYTGALASNGSLEISSDAADRAVCLPVYASATTAELAEIAEIMIDCLGAINVR